MRAPKLDSERLTFLRALEKTKGIFLTQWEAKFIRTANRFQTTSPAFSDKQRNSIDEMFKRYGHQL